MADPIVGKVVAELESGQVQVPYWEMAASADGPTLLIVAAQHGNEVQGAEVLRRFVGQAAGELQAGRIIGVPFCNLPAVWERHHHQHQGPEEPVASQPERNMNLVWPGDSEGNDTARLAYALYSELGASATHVLDIHCWNHFWAAAALPRKNYAPSMDLAAISALPLARASEPANPGAVPTLLAGHFNDTGRAGLSIELAGQYMVNEAQVRLGLRFVINVARFLKMMPGEPEGTDEGPLWRDGKEQAEVTAPRTGLFVQAGLAPGDFVQQGQALGHLISDEDLETVPLIAPVAGRLEAYGCHRADCDVKLAAWHPYASEGDLLARIIVP